MRTPKLQIILLIILLPMLGFGQGIVINEFMASNTNTVTDQDGEYEDWIELYNNSNEDYDLTGHYLSDKPDNLTKWSFPDDVIIAAKGYLIIWADENGSEEGLHANFKLSKNGEDIFLLNPDEIILDEVSFGEQQADLSSARVPNGTGDFVIQEATFAANNDSASNLQSFEKNQNSFILYPNPGRESIHFIFQDEIDKNALIQVFTIQGILMYEHSAKNLNKMDVSSWDRGIYFVKCQSQVTPLIVR